MTPCTSQAHQIGSSVNLTGGANNKSHASSASFTPSSVGYWCFAGYYSSDSNYTASSDTSIDECVNVEHAATTTVTTPSSAKVHTGASVSDTANVTDAAGDGAPTGPVTFYVCSVTATATPCTSMSDELGVGNLGSPTSDSSTITSPLFKTTGLGYECFAAYYSGTPVFGASSDTSVDECVHVIPDLPKITSFSPSSGHVGTVVTVKGTNLAAATKVTLGGKTRTIKSDSATVLKFTVVSGTPTGSHTITITTPGGSVTSATTFKVT